LPWQSGSSAEQGSSIKLPPAPASARCRALLLPAGKTGARFVQIIFHSSQSAAIQVFFNVFAEEFWLRTPFKRRPTMTFSPIVIVGRI
jgi:hypothetical protein